MADDIENGNPADTTLYRPVLDACEADYQSTPKSVVADGGTASHDNVRQARRRGVKPAVFNKPSGPGLHPQRGNQAEGAGFPLARLVGVISLASARVGLSRAR